jgi:hypothetical protein
VAFKTADNIIFVMWKYFKQNIFGSYDKVKLWSNNCVAQNTCWRILFWYGYLVKTKQLKKTVAKTFTVGHTFTLCDAFYGSLETRSYRKQMECQKDWAKLMKECNMNVNYLEQNDFKDWQ